MLVAARCVVDQHEVTVRQYALFLQATGRKPPPTPDPSTSGDLPAVRVRAQEAFEYLRWAGKSLPTEAQWEAAARTTCTNNDLQLQIYTDAGRREGLDVTAAYVHDLRAGERADVDVSNRAVVTAEALVMGAAQRLRNRDYRPSPGKHCRGCEVRTVCPSAKR